MRSTLFALSIAALCACDLGKPAEPEKLESVADAPKHFEARRLEFTGTPRPDLHGEEHWRNAPVGRNSTGSGRELAMFVVPVVPEGWTEDQPVPLWVSRPGNRQDHSDWLGNLDPIASGPVTGKVVDYAGREPGMRKQSGWQRAIEDAERKHGITSDPHAPVVHWPEK